MAADSLFDPTKAQSRAALASLTSRSWHETDFVYLLWDKTPIDGWLPLDHPTRAHLKVNGCRPLYLGKAAGWSSVSRHLAKDAFGSGGATPNDKNAINEGLLAYCLAKKRPGWLAISIQPCDSAEKAQALEREAVALIGWRRDVRLRKSLQPAQVKSLIASGQVAWRLALSKLESCYADLLQAPTPLSQGLLLNQTDPTRDGRGRR